MPATAPRKLALAGSVLAHVLRRGSLPANFCNISTGLSAPLFPDTGFYCAVRSEAEQDDTLSA